MMMKSGDRWRCTNRSCQCAVLVESDGRVEGSNPQCVCGAPMKKAYAPPALRYLQFLHPDEEAIAISGKD